MFRTKSLSLLGFTILGGVVLSYHWHRLPVSNFLQKDLSHTWIKIAGRKFKLANFKPTSTTVDSIENSKYFNLYQFYDICDQSFLYKALVSKRKIGNKIVYIVFASSVEEVQSHSVLVAV